ncbi:MAG: sialidase family protein [Chthoniobacterales bacterium]
MRSPLPIRSLRAPIAVAFLNIGGILAASPNESQQPGGGTWQPTYDRSNWPAAFQNAPLERLSTGALLRLDRNGDLVEPPRSVETRRAAALTSDSQTAGAAVALDRRVGANIRLGDDPAALPSTQRAQAEPHIARAPNDPDFLLATFQEGRYTDGGAIDCGYSVSHDGGLTWSRAFIPKLSTASGGAYPRATDPVARIDQSGVAYLNTLGLNGDLGAVLVSRSTDGGNSFDAPVVAYQSPNSSVSPDKNWMAINPFTPNAGRIVVTFTLFTKNSNATPIVRVLSDDDGLTWSSPAYVHPANYETQGSQPVFLPNNRLAIVYYNFNYNLDGRSNPLLECVTSTDGGATFGTPRPVAPVNPYRPPGIRSGSIIPSATGDGATGNLYVVYQGLVDALTPPRVLFTKSTDGGLTWSPPMGISDNPAATSVFNPAISASPDGQRLTVSYYTGRDNPNSSTLVDLYLAQSLDGGSTWQPNIRVSSSSTDVTLAPKTSGGYMLGDYLGIAETTNPNVPAVPVWIDTRTGDPDPFVARVGIAPALAFTSWQAARLSLGQINDPSLGGEAGDADHDGEDNLSEFRSGTEPNDPLSVWRSSRQLDIATRARVLTGNDVLIAGFIITGNDAKKVIVRAIGPSLVTRGISGTLQDPTLDLRGPSGASVANNDDWRRDDQAGVQATGLAPSDDRESAIVQTLAPGAYTAVVRGKSDSTGVAVVEAYDLSPTGNSRLANLSSRAVVGTDENVIIGGVIVGAGQGVDGAGSARVLVRGIGPSLAQSGVANPLQNPELELVDANGTSIATNDDWGQTQASDIQATGIAPRDQRESALLVTLTKGAYTAILRGRDRTTGTGVVETYNLP